MWKQTLGLALLALVMMVFIRASADEAKPAAKPPEIIILSGNPMGSVKFRHRLHTDVREIQCVTCHHESRPEKPATAPQEACRSCHVTTVVEPMVTNTRAAFHNEDATAGLCISCHIKENAAHNHKLAPVHCRDCHNRANVLPDPTAGN
jgi:hypothetical protein